MRRHHDVDDFESQDDLGNRAEVAMLSWLLGKDAEFDILHEDDIEEMMMNMMMRSRIKLNNEIRTLPSLGYTMLKMSY